MIFLDSSACIEILRGNTTLGDIKVLCENFPLSITTPTIFELYNGVHFHQYSKNKRKKEYITKALNGITQLLKNLDSYDLTPTATEKSSIIYNQLIGQGKEIEVFDCLIAGIILDNGYDKILTTNQDHFERIQDLEVISLKN